MWWVWPFVEVLQGILLDIRPYCKFYQLCQLGCVLNEWEDIVVYSIDLEV